MIRRLWPLALGTFVLGLDAYVLAGLLHGIAHDLGTSAALVGLGVTLFTAAFALSAPALAFVAGRCSTRKALLAGLGLFTLGDAITMLAPSLPVFLAARLLAGVGAGLYSPLASASAAGMVDVSLRGRALAMVLAGLSMGAALGVPAGLLVAGQFGWRWTMGLIVVLGLVAAAGVLNRGGRFPSMPVIPWRDRLAALRAPYILSTLAVTLWIAIGSLGLYTYLAEVAAVRGMAASTHTFIWLWGLGGMTGALLIGRVIDRHLPPARATLTQLALLCTGFALVGYAPLLGVAIGCFVWGLAGWSSMTPQQHALVSHDPAHAIVLIAWNSSISYLGVAIGAAVGSMLLSAQISAAWLPIASLCAAAVAILLHLAKISARK